MTDLLLQNATLNGSGLRAWRKMELKAKWHLPLRLLIT